MDYILPEILSGEIIPVLLGFSTRTMETARRMYRKYGVVSHVFCERAPLALRLAVSMRFHRIGSVPNARLMVGALVDFSQQMGHADVIPYLIPCTEEYASIVWDFRDELERHYVLADLAEMERVWLGKHIDGKEERV